MKQKFSRILVGMIVISAVFVYAHIAKTHDVYDRGIDTSAYKDTTIYLNEELSQTLYAE